MRCGTPDTRRPVLMSFGEDRRLSSISDAANRHEILIFFLSRLTEYDLVPFFQASIFPFPGKRISKKAIHATCHNHVARIYHKGANQWQRR
jgi:hypothetical protein